MLTRSNACKTSPGNPFKDIFTLNSFEIFTAAYSKGKGQPGFISLKVGYIFMGRRQRIYDPIDKKVHSILAAWR